jgi:geranylgeranyl pyrophosphate synthase
MRVTAVASSEFGSPLPYRPLSRQELVDAVDLSSLVEDMVEPTDQVLGTLGKQLRAAILTHAAGCGQRPSHPSIRLGAIAVELLHLGTLTHDDVVDDGRLRRGHKTVGATHGNLTSGFVGSVLIARGAEIVASLGSEPTSHFADTASAMCASQMAEFEDLFDTQRSVERYSDAIAGKTARLFESAAWLGAWLSQASPQASAALSRFAYQFGMVFQIVDDILDLTGTETGKRRGADLRRGIYTLPVIYALEADGALSKMLGQRVDDAGVPALLARIARSDGIDAAIRDCDVFASRARDALRECGVPPRVSHVLARLIDDVVGGAKACATGSSSRSTARPGPGTITAPTQCCEPPEQVNAYGRTTHQRKR